MNPVGAVSGLDEAHLVFRGRCIRVKKRGDMELVYGTRVGKVTPPFSVEKPDELLKALQARCPQASVRRI